MLTLLFSLSINIILIMLPAIISFHHMILLLTMVFSLTIFYIYLPIPNFTYLTKMFSMDLMSTSLILLTLYLVILCFIMTYKNNNLSTSNFYLYLLWTLTLVLLFCFSFNNMFMFYITFEFALIPTMMLIMGWGYQPERFQASLYLMLYTITSSLPMLSSMLMLSTISNPNFNFMSMSSIPLNNPSSINFWWMAMVMVFMVKLPIFMFHLWLPKAHVEAPVVGSMILAGILLKLGGYAFLRFSYIFNFGTKSLAPPMVSIAMWGAILAAMICTTQTDLKSLIAYSSISHMGLMMVAMCSNLSWGWQSSLTIMISHGLCSSGLFSMAATLYEFTNTRNLYMTKGLLVLFPNLMPLFFMLSAFNFGAPPSMNMMGELMALSSSLAYSMIMIPMIIFLLSCVGLYSITLYMVISHGQTTPLFNPLNFSSPRHYIVSSAHLYPLLLYVMNPSLVSTW